MDEREPVGSMKPVDFGAAPKTGTSEGPVKKRREATPVATLVGNKKESWFWTFLKNLFPGNLNTIVNHTIKNYIEPAIKNGIVNAVAMKVFNDINYPGSNGYQYPYNNGYSNSYGYSGNYYQQYWNSRSNNGYSAPQQGRPRLSYRDLVVQNEKQAEEVIKQMWGFIEEFGFATMNDLFISSGYTPNDYQEGNWGWDRIHFRGAGHHSVFGGEKLDIPDPIYVERDR